MGCRCGKRKKLERADVQADPVTATAKTGDVWWFAVPGPGSTDTETMHRTIYEARQAARRGQGNGWTVEGRVVEVADDGV